MPCDVDVLIIGAGPAGSTAASILNKNGVRQLVVEKQVFPRFVIGESLLPRMLDLLRDADLLTAVENQKFMRKNGAMFYRGNETCDFDFSDQVTTGFSYAYQVPRADFDKTLADTVASRGVEFLFNHGVTAVKFHDSHAEITIEQPDKSLRTLTAKFVLDCSGYGRVLPKLLDLEKPSTQALRESLFTHITGDRRPGGGDEGKIWVCVHPQGAWIWIIPFSNGKTSVGVVAEPEFFGKFPAEPSAQLRSILMSDPNAAARLSGMEFTFPPRRITGFSCSIRKIFGPRFALAGNATEFLDPVFSSGATLAVESGARAAKTIIRELHGEPVNWQTDYSDYLNQGISTFRAYVNAWYDGSLAEIFFSSDKDLTVMRQICSVLAGYVWDKSNPYVAQPQRALSLLAKLVRG